tara:strand:+ start:1014 stop:1229 length:216 start_codon:yes stop_codon:yes gene_type:complete
MSVIKTDVCEIEIQEQEFSKEENAACKYMVLVKTGDIKTGSIHISKIILTDRKPIIRKTIDNGHTVNEQNN